MIKRILFAVALTTVFAAGALAQVNSPATNEDPYVDGSGGGGTTGTSISGDLSYHFGPYMQYAKVVYIFWGANSLPAGYAAELQAYCSTSTSRRRAA